MSSNFYSEHSVKARQDYDCQFCGGLIARGLVHVSATNCDAGRYVTVRSHTECHELATGHAAPPPATSRRPVSAAA
jgi:hypothetical protein